MSRLRRGQQWHRDGHVPPPREEPEPPPKRPRPRVVLVGRIPQRRPPPDRAGQSSPSGAQGTPPAAPPATPDPGGQEGTAEASAVPQGDSEVTASDRNTPGDVGDRRRPRSGDDSDHSSSG
jgi:hypothetical protein